MLEQSGRCLVEPRGRGERWLNDRRGASIPPPTLTCLLQICLLAGAPMGRPARMGLVRTLPVEGGRAVLRGVEPPGGVREDAPVGAQEGVLRLAVRPVAIREVDPRLEAVVEAFPLGARREAAHQGEEARGEVREGLLRVPQVPEVREDLEGQVVVGVHRHHLHQVVLVEDHLSTTPS